MKRDARKFFLSAALLGVFILNACAANGEVVSTPSASDIYTAAAHTMTAQSVFAPSTVAIGPTGTSANQTLTPIPTHISPPRFYASLTPLSPSPYPEGAICDNSAHVSDVSFPDHSVVAPGEVFEKTWTLQNIGTCGWTSSYTLNFVYGNQMKGATTPIGQYVLPQQKVNVSVRFTAPSVDGRYTGYWQLANDLGVGFGVRVSVLIDVKTSEPTSRKLHTSIRTHTPTP
jgi:hypothetical protein